MAQLRYGAEAKHENPIGGVCGELVRLLDDSGEVLSMDPDATNSDCVHGYQHRATASEVS